MKNKTKLITHEEVIADFKKIDEDRRKHPVKWFFHDLYYSIIRFCERTPREIKTFIQRGKRGYGDSDIWSLGYYLAGMIENSVKHLKKYENSSPCGMTEGQWIDTLNAISYTFYLAKRCADGDLFFIRDKKQREKFDKTLENINKEHDRNDRCMTLKEIRDYDLGWKLFKTYFFSLWD